MQSSHPTLGKDMTEPQTQPQTAPQSLAKAAPAEDHFKFEIVYLLPILASLLFGLACAFLLTLQHEVVVIPPPTPFNEATPGAPIGNALYFVVLLAVAASIFYILLKRRSKRIIKALIVVALTTASLLLSFFYLQSLFLYFAPDLMDWILPLMIVITVFFDFAIFRLGSKTRNTAIVLLGGALGVFFGNSIPWWSAVAILIFLAGYDVVAVYKGPVGKIAQSGLDDLQGLSFSFKDIQMGLGDLVFYSMLMGLMFKTFSTSIFPALAAIIGILAGSIITFYMLEKKGLFPGLPFPIIMGLAAGFVTALSLGLTVPLILW
jgi:presenilin-like A22 family membrane protease